MENYDLSKELLDFKLFNKNGLEILFTDTGAVQSISYKNIMINQLQGNNIDGCLNNIYLRVFEGKNIYFQPLIKNRSVFAFSAEQNMAFWKGYFSGIEYKLSCHLSSENQWFWEVELYNSSERGMEADLIFTQDLGLAERGGVRTNEAYMSQYIDHTVIKENEYGYAICSRQNQPQKVDGMVSFPWIIHGSFSDVTGYITDGFQFFGLSFKDTNKPEALKEEFLASYKLQYEIAMAGLQTEKVYLEPASFNKTVFFAYFMPDHKEPSNDMDLEAVYRIRKTYDSLKKHHDKPVYRPSVSRNVFDDVVLFESENLRMKDVESLFGKNIYHEEIIDDKLVSFFYGDNRHVVLKEKEFYVERPHGHIMMSGCSIDYSDVRLSSTSYIYGLFNSLISIGNTSFSRVISGTRNPLNVFKSSGQRVFVKIDGEYRLLGLPSAFEIGKNYCNWFYKDGDILIEVTSWTGTESPACYLEIKNSGSKTKMEFMISHEITGGCNERDSIPEIRFDKKSCIVTVKPNINELIISKFPEVEYTIIPEKFDDVKEIGGSEFFYIDSDRIIEDEPYAVYLTKPVSSFKLKITGDLSKENADDKLKFEEFNSAVNNSDRFWSSLINDFKLDLDNENSNFSKLNDIAKCYAHNAMVHYLVPHGLEQYNGAAWGVRDVCQGPVEFFLSTNNFKPVKQIMLCLFSHQYRQRGDWPQWHMFDAFNQFQQKESHGDVIVWPLKALFDYIEASGDFNILNEEVCFTDIEGLGFTKEKASVLEHVRLLIDTIKHDFISGTSLSCYGDGDWDDTLQPANSELRKNMVSGWTVLLTYQAFRKAASVLTIAGKKDFADELFTLSEAIKKDYNKYVIKDDVAAGFLYFNYNNVAEPVIHPQDKRTGIHYRLLPMTRGMISEMFTKEQMEKHLKVIKDHLYCPDGVRLMNSPAQYIGGPNKFFKRAEQASNFGREIGLQYVHAHIRFIEAMAKIGNAEEVYKGLLTINPINISSFVKNAKTRQSNAYFSSSDGDFADRYEAQTNFEKLKVGKVEVKGGWRIYSSGPGIYINQLISSMLGIRIKHSEVEVDPVIPKSLNGLTYSFTYKNKTVKVKYIVENRECSPCEIKINSQKVEFTKLNNPYREGGAVIDLEEFEKNICRQENIIEVNM